MRPSRTSGHRENRFRGARGGTCVPWRTGSRSRSPRSQAEAVPPTGRRRAGRARPVVVATEDHRERPPRDDRPGEVRRVIERALDVGGPHVDVADVGDGPVRHLVGEVGGPGLRIVEPGVGGGEAKGMLPDGTRPHARAREERRAFVEGHPVDRDVGVERVEVRFDARAQERGDPHERSVEPDSGASAAQGHETRIAEDARIEACTGSLTAESVDGTIAYVNIEGRCTRGCRAHCHFPALQGDGQLELAAAAVRSSALSAAGRATQSTRASCGTRPARRVTRGLGRDPRASPG